MCPRQPNSRQQPSSTRAALRFASQKSRFFGGVTRTKNMTVGVAEECPGGSRECGVGHSIAGENVKVGKKKINRVTLQPCPQKQTKTEYACCAPHPVNQRGKKTRTGGEKDESEPGRAPPGLRRGRGLSLGPLALQGLLARHALGLPRRRMDSRGRSEALSQIQSSNRPHRLLNRLLVHVRIARHPWGGSAR